MIKKGFTLTELLIALGIIGAIAAISIPSLIGAINKKQLTLQAKNTLASINQMMSDELVDKKVKTLKETDFTTPDDLMTVNHFTIATKCETAASCWTENYKILSDKTEASIPGKDEGEMPTVILKNGTILSYKRYTGELADGDNMYGIFYFDINGVEPPNLLGRDYFSFVVTEKGRTTHASSDQSMANADLKSGCTEGTMLTGCLAYIQNNGWKMDY